MADDCRAVGGGGHGRIRYLSARSGAGFAAHGRARSADRRRPRQGDGADAQGIGGGQLRLAAIAADRDNLKQQLDALQKPAPAPAGDKAKDKDKAAAAMQKQLDAATRQRDAALSEAAALKRRTQQLEAQPRPAPAPLPPLPAAGGKVYTQRSVAELRELYAGGEAAPGTPPAADETGKWIETTSMRVVGIAGGGVLLLKKDNSNIQCAFADAAKAKLATLRVGDAVKVTGKINQDQNGQLVNLEDCELRE